MTQWLWLTNLYFYFWITRQNKEEFQCFLKEKWCWHCRSKETSWLNESGASCREWSSSQDAGRSSRSKSGIKLVKVVQALAAGYGQGRCSQRINQRSASKGTSSIGASKRSTWSWIESERRGRRKQCWIHSWLGCHTGQQSQGYENQLKTEKSQILQNPCQRICLPFAAFQKRLLLPQDPKTEYALAWIDSKVL